MDLGGSRTSFQFTFEDHPLNNEPNDNLTLLNDDYLSNPESEDILPTLNPKIFNAQNFFNLDHLDLDLTTPSPPLNLAPLKITLVWIICVTTLFLCLYLICIYIYNCVSKAKNYRVNKKNSNNGQVKVVVAPARDSVSTTVEVPKN